MFLYVHFTMGLENCQEKKRGRGANMNGREDKRFLFYGAPKDVAPYEYAVGVAQTWADAI